MPTADARGHQAAERGDPAFAEGRATAELVSKLFCQHHRMLVGYLMSRLRSEQEAKEVAQEAYVRLLQASCPQDPGMLRAYLFKIASNLAIDRLRHAQVQRRAEEQAEPFMESTTRGEADDPARQWLTRERVEQLLGYLEELPEACRQVIDLHRLQGLAQQEVAAQLGFSERMVRRYLNYAMVYCHLRFEGLGADQVKVKVRL